MNIRQYGKAILAICAGFALLAGAACSSGGARYETASSAAYAAAAPSPELSKSMSGGFAMQDEEEILDAVDYDVAEAPAAQGVNNQTVNAGRMIITTVDLHMQTTEFDRGVDEIQVIVADFDGFIQDSYIQGKSMYEKYGTRSANFTARIPSSRLDAFINSVGGAYHVISKQQSGQDITDSYYDTEARLNSLKIQEERLLAMMEEATELQYLIEIQRELANVQYQIDSFTSSKLRMENQVSMSTVHLTLNEVVEYTPVEPEPITFRDRFGRTVADSLDSFVAFGQGFVLLVVWLTPFLLVISIPAIVIILVVRSSNKKRKARINIDKGVNASDSIQEQPEKSDEQFPEK